jgi:hypothetical protein
VAREPFRNTAIGILFLGIVSSLIATFIWTTGSQQVNWSWPTPPTPTPAKIIDAYAFSGTRWRGRVGRAPASLEILQRPATGDWVARMRYTGVVEDVTVTMNPNGSITLTGKAYRREIGNGDFALDTFSGQLSPDKQHLRGTLIDGAGLRGQWSVTKVDNASAILADTTNLLSPDSVSTTHWLGTVGKSTVSFDILPRTASGEWLAKATYREIREDLNVSVRDDGTVVFSGISYQEQPGTPTFWLGTFYGELSADGNRLEGLRIDSVGNRDPWEAAKTGSTREP